MANYTSTHTGAVIDSAVTKVNNITATATELNVTDGLTVTTAELNQLDDKTVGGTNNDDIVDVNSSQPLKNKTLDGGTFI
mgnify:CR=1 FL=1|jgi:carbohydrate-binding DOMON domain-containing protein|tara:strand:- start:1073 stop:1312 length:240 start_codon:yes stop_codon:yes gene_type:complete